MPRRFDQMPIEAAVVVPFVPLTEFAAHEKQLLARMPEHPGVEHSEVSELLPLIARHPIEKRSFPMHDFIVAKNQNEMFLISVKEREGDAALMKAPVNRIERHVMKKIVHPSLVPLEAETEPAQMSRPRNAGPRR